jgi:peptidoglycan/LPS O-acetylase OafA/YrhL
MTTTAPDRRQPLSRRVRRTWADAPAAVQALVIAALFYAWLWDEPAEGSGALVLRIGFAALVGTLAVGSRRIRARLRPGAPREVEVSEATEDGELPAGADASAWLRALERRRHEIRQETWSMPVALVLVVGVAFLVVLPARGGDGDPRGAADAVALVALAVLTTWCAWHIVSRPVRRDRVDALLIPLQERSRQDAEERAAWAPPAPGDRIPPAAG